MIFDYFEKTCNLREETNLVYRKSLNVLLKYSYQNKLLPIKMTEFLEKSSCKSKKCHKLSKIPPLS